jgi:hypothetical protein
VALVRRNNPVHLDRFPAEEQETPQSHRREHQIAPLVFPTIDPMAWAFVLWTVAIFASLIVSRALSPALRGAFVGRGNWIADYLGARLSQLAAVTSIFLLVHLGLTAIRASKSKLMATGAGLLGTVPSMILMLAQKGPLPQAHGWAAALCAAFALFLCSRIARTSPAARWIMVLASLNFLCTALAATEFQFGGDPRLLSLLAALESLSATGAVTLLILELLWVTRKRPWLMPLVFGICLLLAVSATASSRIDASPGLLLIGRAVSELAPHSDLGDLAPFAISSVLASVLVGLLYRPSSLERLACSVLVLGVLVPTSPLVTAWVTVCAFFLVVLGGNPQSTARTSAVITMTK